MTIRGTHNLIGKEADEYLRMIEDLEDCAMRLGFERFIPSSLVSGAIFENQMGDNRVFKIEGSLSGGEEVILLPEVTAVVRQEYKKHWKKTMPKPVEIFYTSRCYRYDRPQRGRYREFTQFGMEQMPADYAGNMGTILKSIMIEFLGYNNFEFRKGVKRGLGYYNADGFEVWANGLQIAGGGPYEEGEGFAIGVERLLIARGIWT